MQILLTNDDGIEAPGLEVLEGELRRLGRVVVVAPDSALSGCSHQVNTQRPIRVRRLGEDRYATDGTPADCVRLGLSHLASEANWVVAGINDGGNLGVDVYLSGTVAAVREGALFGKPAIAFSHYRRKGIPIDWPTAGVMTARVLEILRSRTLEPEAFWNVNFPHLDGEDDPPEVVFCPLDHSQLPIDYEARGWQFQYRGVYRQRDREPGTDVDVCFAGRIAVTQVVPSPSR
ncbi:MAG: 5'/3'-nucleotidase SurE [Planctomycetota bacterium]|jgi:5'-nucleotidase